MPVSQQLPGFQIDNEGAKAKQMAGCRFAQVSLVPNFGIAQDFNKGFRRCLALNSFITSLSASKSGHYLVT